MFKAIKFLIIGIVILFILVTATLFAVTSLVDPNDYKPELESAIHGATGVSVEITGNIDWSIYPWLGLELNEVQVNTTEGNSFTTLNNMQARVAFMSLMNMSPSVEKLVVDGLQVNLEKDKDGTGNWEKLSSQQTAHPAKKPKTEEQKQPAEDNKANAKQEINFAVSEVALTNITINYVDKAANRTLLLSPLNLTATNITKDTPFPIAMDFTLSDGQSGLDTVAKIKTTVTMKRDFKHITLSPFAADFALSGKPFGAKTVATKIDTNITLDQETHTLSIANMSLNLANLAALIDLQVSGLDKTPRFDGKASVAPFSLQKLLGNLGQKPIPTTDAKVLDKVAFSSSIKSPTNRIALPNLEFTLDDTLFKGNITIDQRTSRIIAKVNGNAIDIDRYVAPKQEKVEGQKQQRAQTTPSRNTSDDDNLPIKMLKELNFDISANLQQLVAQNMTIKDITIQATAKNGIVKLGKAAGQLYDGSFLVTANINVATQKPTWKLHSEINHINLLPMLKDFRELTYLAGNLNFNADIASTGKNLTQLQDNADGTASFNIDQGALEGVNFRALACLGVASLLGKTVDISQREPRTTFNAMSGTVKIDGRTLSNPSLLASLAGISLGGQGQVNTATKTLDYGMELKVVGELGDPNCKVNKYLKDVAIPVKCTGIIGGDSAPQCGLDSKRLSAMLEQLAKREAKRKIDKAIDRKLDKWLNKNKNTDPGANTEKQQQKEDGKEAVKGLIHGLFQ
ncbi:MAG: hypothetical protein CSA50_00080 [Gammaproteobacteria bacterium]|nr:MAG: hypothetical protein CSA50_00080 [Gammaproteobacteria bacterium]